MLRHLIAYLTQYLPPVGDIVASMPYVNTWKRQLAATKVRQTYKISVEAERNFPKGASTVLETSHSILWTNVLNRNELFALQRYRDHPIRISNDSVIICL